ncbi:MAG: 50S ribosomal protein L32 [Candidatus Pacebacteria bacterium]|jgi:large subunit ribosomal protein L32|nr:50S ribosomal protein L32 [Candidatus Paceibacterota bacterium]MDD4994395.1 50S ribosomal protein L32 [Candidatus Paceibacterota bacterium]MDD5535100.1 50S ribosomal protein L32 [Candidatus Paceibacterota bacterium]
MGVPARHHTRSRVDKRRSHAALKPLSLIKCSHCGEMIPSHKICPFCGYYKDKEVIDVFKGLNKKEKKQKQKEIEEEK